MAKAVTPKDQRALVDRLMSACGGSYSPERRRKHFISGPQWAAAYQGQALFHAPTREPVSAGEVIRHFAEIGIGYWTTHDTDVISTEDLMTDRQAEIVDEIKKALRQYGRRCAIVSRRNPSSRRPRLSCLRPMRCWPSSTRGCSSTRTWSA